jgi:ribosomal protein S18 acetylase RimI-like enzyme
MDPLPKTTVRSLEAKDVEAIVALDARIVGRRRDGYLRPKLAEALKDVGIRASLVVEHDGRPAGFLLAKVWYGEFGELDPVAVLDTIGVDPLLRAHGLATEMSTRLA